MFQLSILSAICFFAAGAAEPVRPTVFVVVGAPGTEEFGEQFKDWSDRWRAAAESAAADFRLIGAEPSGDESDRNRLQAALANLAAEGSAPLWLVLIGHGTYDGQAAKFNLRGPDVEAAELAGWLKRLDRPVAVLNCASGSGPFINRIAGGNRVVISATRSGSELNYARFGQYISAAINDSHSDLDKDGQVSLLEAYLTASRQVQEFYDQEARLATEHALLDDNGDGLGTPAAWFRGLRATQRAKGGASLDGTRAHQFHLVMSDRELRMPAELRNRRNELELQIAALRNQRDQLADDAYFTQLEPLMLELARLYRAHDASESVKPTAPSAESAGK
jgi:hypothetical protein